MEEATKQLSTASLHSNGSLRKRTMFEFAVALSLYFTIRLYVAPHLHIDSQLACLSVASRHEDEVPFGF